MVTDLFVKESMLTNLYRFRHKLAEYIVDMNIITTLINASLFAVLPLIRLRRQRYGLSVTFS
jgi:hypothetical protein